MREKFLQFRRIKVSINKWGLNHVNINYVAANPIIQPQQTHIRKFLPPPCQAKASQETGCDADDLPHHPTRYGITKLIHDKIPKNRLPVKKFRPSKIF